MTLVEEPISYRDAEVALSGVLMTTETRRPRPGLLLIHGGAGLDDHARGQAARYAELGLTVFACDMFGNGVAGDRERVMAVLMALRDDPAGLARRGQAALDVLAARPEVNGQAAVIGFCFGGMAALTLGRFGVPVDGIVSMHGSLTTSYPAQPGMTAAHVLVCHGALDPHVPMNDVAALSDELTSAGIDYQINVYGGAMHGFTHEHAAPGVIPGVEYHAVTDRRSFAAAKAFFKELF